MHCDVSTFFRLQSAKPNEKKITKWINYVQSFICLFWYQIFCASSYLSILCWLLFFSPDSLYSDHFRFIYLRLSHTKQNRVFLSPISLSQYLSLSPINGGTDIVHLFMALFCQQNRQRKKRIKLPKHTLIGLGSGGKVRSSD